MGFGRNSVALYLHLLEQGLTPGDAENGFEAVFVNHETDWPETYEYAAMFMENYPVTVLGPEYKGYNNLYEYYADKEIFPFRMRRDCSHKFKVIPLEKYYKTPCWLMTGIDAGEAHRARPHSRKGIETRWPLIEHDIDLQGCIDIIKRHGLPVPPKSGCYICPFQPLSEFKRLRREHPDLFCKARKMEDAYVEKRKREGKGPFYILDKAPIGSLVNDQQAVLPGVDYDYPPCQCGL